MTSLSVDDYIQAIVAVFVITDPIGKSIFFLLFDGRRTTATPTKRTSGRHHAMKPLHRPSWRSWLFPARTSELPDVK